MTPFVPDPLTYRFVQLDPAPQRVHDSEPEHPESCWCSICAERDRLREIEATFTPWHKDVYQLARLWRWLELVDEVPRDPALWLETALSWSEQFDRMNEAAGG